MISWQWFRIRYVESSSKDCPVTKSFYQVACIDDRPSAYVDEYGVFFHLRKLRLVEKSSGLVVQRNCYEHEITLSQKFIQRHILRAQFLFLPGMSRVEETLDFETAESLYYPVTDVPETHYSNHRIP